MIQERKLNLHFKEAVGGDHLLRATAHPRFADILDGHNGHPLVGLSDQAIPGQMIDR
jgi:hypothetical protein